MVNTVLPYTSRSNANFYPSIRRLFTTSKGLLSPSYDLDLDRNLKMNYINLLLMLLCRVYYFYLYASAQYKKLQQINLFNIELFMEIITPLLYLSRWGVAFHLAGNISGVQKVFKQLKVIDDKIKLSKKRECEFSSATTSRIRSVLFISLLSYFGFALYKGGEKVIVTVHEFFITYLLITCDFFYALPMILFQLMVLLCTYYVDYIYCELKDIMKCCVVSSDIYTLDKLSIENHSIHFSERVKHLRYLLVEVDSLKNEINRAFGTIISVSIIIFHVQISHLICHLWYFSPHSHIHGIKWIDPFISICAVAPLCLGLCGAVKTSSALARNGQKLAEVVHELLAEDLDDRVKKELTIFSLTLLHREKGVVTNGLFRLNNRLWAIIFLGVSLGLLCLYSIPRPN